MSGIAQQRPRAAAEVTAPRAVAMTGIVKSFGPVRALDGVDFDLEQGEIHGLLGENGAGKTTLMNILYGLVRPDAGEVVLGGEHVRLHSARDAIARGIGMVHQHFMLVPRLTVAENMILGERELVVGKRRLSAVAKRLRDLEERYGIAVDPDARVWQLSVGEQQRVEILRALYHDARVLILDEPTALLSPLESEHLLPKLRVLASEGVSIVFITHHLDEVLEWSDRITVLRLGSRVGTVLPSETDAAALARMMVGRDVTLVRVVRGDPWRPVAGEATGDVEAAPAVLQIRDLAATNDRGIPALDDVSFDVPPGEIVAVAGVEGNGQGELEEVLLGVRPPTSGSVVLDGRDIRHAEPEDRLRAGMRFIPSDRYRRGLIRALSVANNLVFDQVGRPPFGSRFFLRKDRMLARARELIDRFAIRVSRPEQPAATLSGGNAQRVVLARALSRETRCLVAAQPTRGLDVGAIESVWEQLDAVRRSGVGILLISADLDEVLALADRCLVLYRGRIVAEFDSSHLDREAIGLAMGGAVGAVGDGR